ncbi:UNKNOWN [Stylonychia lemnae]|uniref:Uncharacterized protein n=1 Tax=Stylonychia lemnae TaxID=5949 RepID=A0A078BBV0_STYLE|nr:UNKNOWN [Stylonychia lemnae]|eukprot:CDW91068.1 UNKNOWN [Stylonychia lemnae]
MSQNQEQKVKPDNIQRQFQQQQKKQDHSKALQAQQIDRRNHYQTRMAFTTHQVSQEEIKMGFGFKFRSKKFVKTYLMSKQTLDNMIQKMMDKRENQTSQYNQPISNGYIQMIIQR